MNFRDQLREAVESRHSRHHPFYKVWAEGKLSKQQMAGWVQEQYHFTRDFTWIYEPMLRGTPKEVQQAYREAIDEEKDHPEILLRFGLACGLTRAKIEKTKPLPTTQALLDWIYRLGRHRSMVEFMAGLNIGLESQPPHLYGKIIPTLLNHYGFTEQEIYYFPLHGELDVEHSKRAYRLVEKYATTNEQKQNAILAAREGAEKRYFYIDGVYLQYVQGYHLTDKNWDSYQYL